MSIPLELALVAGAILIVAVAALVLYDSRRDKARSDRKDDDPGPPR
jgi:hypothetical protein